MSHVFILLLPISIVSPSFWLFGDISNIVNELEPNKILNCIEVNDSSLDCIGVISESCLDHSELCVNRETFAWQYIGDYYLRKGIRVHFKNKRSLLVESQLAWKRNVENICEVELRQTDFTAVIARLERARCYRKLTAERAFILQRQLKSRD